MNIIDTCRRNGEAAHWISIFIQPLLDIRNTLTRAHALPSFQVDRSCIRWPLLFASLVMEAGARYLFHIRQTIHNVDEKCIQWAT